MPSPATQLAHVFLTFIIKGKKPQTLYASSLWLKPFPLCLPAMSMVPSSARMVSQTTRYEYFEGESFHKFFDCWLVEQNQHLQDLFAAASTHAADVQLQELIERVIEHYESYYKTKSRCAKKDVLGMLSPTWRSSLEEAFLWIGGWRPSMAFHLLYSKSGLQFEARLTELIQELKACDLGSLSAAQLAQMDELHRRTVTEERKVTEKMAKHQETVADTSMVELSNVVSEIIRSKEKGQSSVTSELEEKVASTIAPKECGLEDILQKADDLRLRTLKEVVHILTSTQAIHFLIAAAELHLRFHEWGKKKDEDARKDNRGMFVGETHDSST